MTSTSTMSSSSAVSYPFPPKTQKNARRRRISPEAGRALEILGHAIDYLTDEYIEAGGSFSAHDSQIEAVQLLMGMNRQIYFSCPEVPSFADRCRALLRPHLA